MPVIKRNADIIQSQAFEELGVDIGEEVLKELNSIRYEITMCYVNGLVKRTLSKKNSDFSLPITPPRASRIWNSQPGYPDVKAFVSHSDEVTKYEPEIKFSMLEAWVVSSVRHANQQEIHFIHPPRPAPRRMTSSPLISTIFVPEILR